MSAIRDNYTQGSLGEYLREKIKPDSRLAFVSAYFTIYAYDKLRQDLDGIQELRFLFGEPSFLSNLDPDKSESKTFVLDNSKIELGNRLQQKLVARECADWIRAKTQIRSVKQKGFLHGKLYHIENNGVNEAILGSSNLTVSGLGLGTRSNIELNLEVNDRRDREDLKRWFDELWSNTDLVQDVRDEVLSYLEQVYVDKPPEFIYFKTLYHIFEKFLTDEAAASILQDDIKMFDTGVWKMLFEFQKDGAKGAINKLLKYNGCIIADSVGLGKTFEALAVIKYFELKNQNVLVLCPKKLRDNWTIYKINDQLNPFYKDRYRYDVLSHTDLSRDGGHSGDIDLKTINWGNYDLVVIDESHNFRNDTKGKRNEEGEIVRKSRYERLMDDIVKAGVRTKVLMLSATPVNTNLRDLRNQIYFATESKDDAFKDTMGLGSLRDTIAESQRRFTLWADPKKNPNRNVKDLLEQLPSSFFKLLDGLTIARSRRHVERYYKHEMQRIGAFPKRLKPHSLAPNIDLKKRFMSYDRLSSEIDDYELSLFQPSRFLIEGYRKEYEEKARSRGVRVFTQANREHFLIGMMKVNFMKRLESSIKSFEITMERTIAKIENLENRINRFKKFQAENPELDFDELKIETLEDEELQEALEVGEKFTYKMAHLMLDEWLAALRKDKEQLSILHAAAVEITPDRDMKLAELKKLIEEKVKHPTTSRDGRKNRKVLLFTAFADTADYLYSNLKEWVRNDLGVHIALVTGGTKENQTTLMSRGFHRQSEYSSILANFSPVSKNRSKMQNMPQNEEIEVLVATDCISEGQNLQDCDYLINYDIHWNPVRIIQRFGRIDRIGSINDTVQLVNFWPTDDLNKYINLKHRVEARMALVDVAATSEEDVLQMDDLQDLIKEDMRYRDKQLLRLKDEILDLEDFNENVSLSEFTLDDFRLELARYIEANREQLEDAPFGLYGLVPPSPEFQQIQPGVVFCLKQKGETSASDKVTPVQPYYLVYIRDDGTVRYSFTQTKQILEIFRLLCLEKKEAYVELCRLFDAATDQGKDMTKYNELLGKAVQAVVSTFKRRALKNLTEGRDAVLVPQTAQPQEVEDFELVTWLVIVDKPSGN
jgi:SNF2 family DNA or RNA helicase